MDVGPGNWLSEGTDEDTGKIQKSTHQDQDVCRERRSGRHEAVKVTQDVSTSKETVKRKKERTDGG